MAGRHARLRERRPLPPDAQRESASSEVGPPSYPHAVRTLQRHAGNRAASRALAATSETARGHEAPVRRVVAPSVKTAQVAPGAPPRGAGSSAQSKRPRNVAARQKIGIEKVAPNATALGQLGGDYGITWPQSIRLTHGAKLEGDNWALTVNDITGDYSVQARILGHQADVTSAAIATQATYQEICNSLDALGDPGNTFHFYSLKAVQAHESKHATRALQALMDVREQIQAKFAGVTIARANNQETQLAAVARLQALPAYTTAMNESFALWDAQFDTLINGDHTGDGPCELAEKSITVPLKNAIMERAKTERWIAPPPQVPLV